MFGEEAAQAADVEVHVRGYPPWEPARASRSMQKGAEQRSTGQMFCTGQAIARRPYLSPWECIRPPSLTAGQDSRGHNEEEPLGLSKTSGSPVTDSGALWLTLDFGDVRFGGLRKSHYSVVLYSLPRELVFAKQCDLALADTPSGGAKLPFLARVGVWVGVLAGKRRAQAARDLGSYGGDGGESNSPSKHTSKTICYRLIRRFGDAPKALTGGLRGSLLAGS